MKKEINKKNCKKIIGGSRNKTSRIFSPATTLGAKMKGLKTLSEKELEEYFVTETLSKSEMKEFIHKEYD